MGTYSAILEFDSLRLLPRTVSNLILLCKDKEQSLGLILSKMCLNKNEDYDRCNLKHLGKTNVKFIRDKTKIIESDLYRFTVTSKLKWNTFVGKTDKKERRYLVYMICEDGIIYVRLIKTV